MSATRLLAAAALAALATQSIAQEAPAPESEAVTEVAPVAEAAPAPAPEAAPADAATDAPAETPAAPPAGTPAEPAAEQGEIEAALHLLALKPVLNEDGTPQLDEAGEPIEAFQPVGEGVALLPGDQVRYVFVMDNQGPLAQNLEVALDVPPAGLLLAESVTASRETGFQLGSSTEAALRIPLLAEIDGKMLPNPAWLAAPERFDQLVAKIALLEHGEQVTVTYDLVVK